VFVSSNVVETYLIDGSIHIWDRESGTPVRRIAAQVVMSGRRCVAWSAPQADSMRFATVGVNELRIWSATQTIPELPSLPEHTPPISIPISISLTTSRVLPPAISTIPTEWDLNAGDTVPSPRSAISVKILDMPDGTPASISYAPYHSRSRYSDTEDPPDMDVLAAS
jgi:hypothetical protein